MAWRVAVRGRAGAKTGPLPLLGTLAGQFSGAAHLWLASPATGLGAVWPCGAFRRKKCPWGGACGGRSAARLPGWVKVSGTLDLMFSGHISGFTYKTRGRDMTNQQADIRSDIDPALAEIEATGTIYEKLKPLTPEAQTRVLNHVSGMLALKIDRQGHRQKQEQQDHQDQDEGNGNENDIANLEREQKTAPKFATFADLADAANPMTNAKKALVAGYWLQVCQNAESFDAFTANKELKRLGHGLPNITIALDALRNEKPALALQLSKSGKSQQARKTYKLTVAGIKAVEAMING
jgi:hypothetical protein